MLRLKLNDDLLMAGLFFVGTTVYLSQALKLPLPFKEGEPGASFFPLILTAIMYAMAFKTFVQGWRKAKSITLDLTRPQVVRPVIAIGATAFYILSFPLAGYWISTIFYTFVIALLFELGRKHTLTKSIFFCFMVALSITLFGWLFFVKLFELSLPQGVF